VRPRRSYIDYLQAILQASNEAMAFTAGMDFATFNSDRRTTLAATRALEIMGEAARHVPANVRRRYPQVPWQDITDMRNKVIHEYFGGDLEVVWRTIQEDLPPLCEAIQRVLTEMEMED
jgi:uncharacterized protein with HEPN domain